MRFSRLCSLAALLLVVLASAGFSPPLARADNWPAWRGPTGQGTSAEKSLPVEWSATKNVKWKVSLPDSGNSTPIVWGAKIFLTQATEGGKKRSLLCLNRKDGSKLWEKTVAFGLKEPKHNTNTFCAASPVTDGERVVVSHGSAGVYCYDLGGKELWHRDFGPGRHIWGSASSPVIYKDRVIFYFGPGEKTFLIAMNKKDGTDIWKVEERAGKPEEYIGVWGTPVIADMKGRMELVMNMPGAVKGYNPETGAVLWSCKGLEKDSGQDRLTYASPLVGQDVIVGMAGFGGPSIGLKTGGTGDITGTHRLWRTATNPQRIGSGVIIGEYVYVVNEPGIACLELKTGKEKWRESISGGLWSSILHADGRLYVVSQTGETVVFAPNPKEFEVIARNKLGDGTTRASVITSDGDLFIRTYKSLWCIGKK